MLIVVADFCTFASGATGATLVGSFYHYSILMHPICSVLGFDISNLRQTLLVEHFRLISFANLAVSVHYSPLNAVSQ